MNAPGEFTCGEILGNLESAVNDYGFRCEALLRAVQQAKGADRLTDASMIELDYRRCLREGMSIQLVSDVLREQWRDAESISKLLYRVFFSHEREGVIELNLVRDADRCAIVMMAFGLPKVREDISKRIPEISAYVTRETGEAGLAK